MKGQKTPAEIAHDALQSGFDAFKAALEPKVGESVNHRLWMGSVHELRGPVKIVDLKRDDASKRITHLKLEDSPCWLKIADILRI